MKKVKIFMMSAVIAMLLLLPSLAACGGDSWEASDFYGEWVLDLNSSWVMTFNEDGTASDRFADLNGTLQTHSGTFEISGNTLIMRLSNGTSRYRIDSVTATSFTKTGPMLLGCAWLGDEFTYIRAGSHNPSNPDFGI